MVSDPLYARIDTLELKSLIIKKIGHQRADKYFDQLTRLFSFKTTKREFDKFCAEIIGTGNIPLHNRFIKSIVKNACLAKFPPPRFKRVGSNMNKASNGYQKNFLQSFYGDVFPPSPRKGRSPVNRDRMFRDRPSPLRPHGKPQNLVYEESNSRVHEQQSATELLSLGSRPPVEVASVEDGEEVEQVAVSPGVQSRSPVTAPFGVSMNLGGSRKSLSSISTCSSSLQDTCLSNTELPDTQSLRSRLELKLEMEGINVSVECVNLLNNGLDTYLKRLIEPCMSLAGSRGQNKQSKRLNDQYICHLNGIVPVGHMKGSLKPVYATMSDFRVAMESNPQILGEDWPTKLERISLCASEE